MKNNYKIRAVQLDLARRMESVPFILAYIDFIAENHFNTLFLYLEWRIRTVICDLGPEEGYSATDLRQIIEYAQARGITVIPGLATLGHAELLLSKAEFSGFSELREGQCGRFENKFTHDLCPSLPEVRQFLHQYIGEVAAIFAESPYIHVGGDEVWDIGFCSQCQTKISEFADEEQLYLNHFKFVHNELKALNKKMMMWDDMLECYPDILEDIPRDIILVHWQYNENVWSGMGHFSNLNFKNWFEPYEKLGFQYLFAPTDWCWSNIETFSAYAKNFSPLGGLLTSWEKRTSLLFKYLPTIGATGQLWNNVKLSGDEALFIVIKQIFGIAGSNFSAALTQYLQLACHFLAVYPENFTSFSFFGPDNLKFHSWKNLYEFFNSFVVSGLSPLAQEIMRDITLDCQLKLLQERSYLSAWKYFHHQAGQNLADLCREINHFASIYRQSLLEHRGANGAVDFDRAAQMWTQNLQDIQTKISKCSILHVVLGIEEFTSAPKLRIAVNGQNIADGVFKHDKDTLFEKFFFLPGDAEVNNIQFEARGFGAQKIAYVQVIPVVGSRKIPDQINYCSGQIINPEAVLRCDATCAILGNCETQAGFRNRHIPNDFHKLEITMKKLNN